jgi:hypothetical protein
MEFEYALVLKTYSSIYAIGNQYFGDKVAENKDWQIFQKSSNY